MLAETGTMTLISQGSTSLASCIPQLILPLKQAIRSYRPAVVLRALCALRSLAVSSPRAGRAILGYHRHLLPAMNQYVFL